MLYPGSLHNHTDYSNLRLRDSINNVESVINRAIELGHNCVAFTEHETIANAIKIEDAAGKIKDKYPNFKVIRGNEIYLVRDGLNKDNFNKEVDRYTHFILLALDAEGHKQIRELSTRAWLRSYMARGMRRVPTYYQDLIDIVAPNPGHIVASSACIGGTLGVQLLRYRESPNNNHLQKIKQWCLQIEEIFGKGNFYLEMQPSFNAEQIYVNKWIVKLSEELNIPFIITNDAHYLKKEDLKIQKIFLNSQGGDREVEDFYGTTYLMSDDEIHQYLDEQIGRDKILQAYQNIVNIANRAQDYTLKKPLKIPSLKWREQPMIKLSDMEYYLEQMPTLKKFLASEFEADRLLVSATINGIKKHGDLQNDNAYKELELCLQDTWVSSQVNKAQWSAYFLNLQNIIDVCWDAGTIVGCGRGSGVGFLLLYCLDITQINPLRETTKTYRFRFLNPDRVSVLDIDSDITGLNRNKVLAHIREVYGDDRVANVLTLRTEKSKSAVLAAARGLGIDVDIAQYIASLIPAERGALWNLSDCYYGNEDEGRQAVRAFVNEMNQYPELWEVVQQTEGLIVGMGEHAGGIVFVDEPFTESTALMRAPNGDIMTQFELHTAESASLIKYDMLSVEAIDKIQICLELLVEYGQIPRYSTLRETYENCIGIYNLEREDPEMWQMVWEHRINALFQMEQQSGINAINLAHPSSIDDLATLNSVIRLMPQEKGGEIPLEKFARFKNNINLWYKEMRDWGLTEEEIKLLEPVAKISYGITESQEAFMTLVQMPECGGFNLTWADRLRKSIAKKNPKEFDQLTKEYFENAKEKGLSQKLCSYVWNVLVAYSRGYGFNKSHTLAYSLLALQEMNLAYRFPIIFWNCACLISEAGGSDDESNEDEILVSDREEYFNEMPDFNEEEDEEEDSYEEGEDCDGYPVDVVKTPEGKKKKAKAVNYGKIASAIGRIKSAGVIITSPNINNSAFTFAPDLEHNAIRYGLSGITRIGEELVRTIIQNRPYTGIDDFLSRVKVNKPQMFNLLKCGAFDDFGDRVELMHQYAKMVSEPKKRVTLQNMQMLIDFELLPDEYWLPCSVFLLNKYLKKINKETKKQFLLLDNASFKFFEEHLGLDPLTPNENAESGFAITADKLETIYQKHMDKIRPYVKANAANLLTKINGRLEQDVWNKYCTGSISKWEMDSISCYIHEHELTHINKKLYGFVDFDSLDSIPDIERIVEWKGKQIPIFRLYRICGTVLHRDKTKKLVTLLTSTGVVTVKIYGPFAQYDKQISERGADGKKHVLERSSFSRGNKIIVTGIRQDDAFVAKTYKVTPFHKVEIIDSINDEGYITTHTREEA